MYGCFDDPLGDFGGAHAATWVGPRNSRGTRSGAQAMIVFNCVSDDAPDFFPDESEKQALIHVGHGC
jgi:hypothetical protein